MYRYELMVVELERHEKATFNCTIELLARRCFDF
jgi:hypothetical protein